MGTEQFKDPVPPGQRPGFVDSSWLGQFATNGWAIRIDPRLSNEQWAAFGERVHETWHEKSKTYSARQSDVLLRELFQGYDVTYFQCPCNGDHPHSKVDE